MSTSSPVLSFNIIFGNLSPNFKAPFPPVSAGADLGASTSFSAAAAAAADSSSSFEVGLALDFSPVLGFSEGVGFAEVGLGFLDAGPDLGFSSASLYVINRSSARIDLFEFVEHTFFVEPGFFSTFSSFDSGAASPAIRDDLRDTAEAGTAEAGFFGGMVDETCLAGQDMSVGSGAAEVEVERRLTDEARIYVWLVFCRGGG